MPAMVTYAHLRATEALRSTVVVLHGFRASGAGQRHDGEAFVTAHTEVVMPDAPGHGAREDGTLAALDRLDDAARRAEVLALASRWAEELHEVVEVRRVAGAERVALVGISMGGYAALAAWSRGLAVDAVAVALAGFDLAETTSPIPLMVGLAALDESIPYAPAVRAARAAGAEIHAYPASGHFMRGGDWHDLWGRTARFVHAHLEG